MKIFENTDVFEGVRFVVDDAGGGALLTDANVDVEAIVDSEPDFMDDDSGKDEVEDVTDV